VRGGRPRDAAQALRTDRQHHLDLQRRQQGRPLRSRALALETAADNVLVNCVAPGLVDTDLSRRVLGAAGMRKMARQIPLGRFATADEIARHVAFLAGPQNTYMTGQNVLVDGGYVSA
jgi:NAD(P)-dependent dehydrogenase (short-subunit alcohol dehydrogenase family)